MAHPVLAILEQVAEKAAESEVVRSVASVLEKIELVKSGVSEALVAKVEAAAHSAGKFFGISDAELIVGRAIDAYHDCEIFVKKTVFEFVLDRFKDVMGVSVEDMMKIWAHECGCRILEKDNSLSAWAKELGAGFFTGVRSEMLGLPKSDFEKVLESAKESETCPEGTLRVNAIQYGRDVVRRFQSNGVEPTIENCKEEFVNSPYSKITYENQGSPKFNVIVKDKLSENAELPRDTDNTNSNPNRVEDAELSKDSSVGKKSEINESQMNEVKKTGGSYGELKKEWGWHSEPPKENHHMPSNESSYLDINDGPAIAMDYQDHKQTASWGRSREAQEYRAKQKELIDQGKFREALQMDIDDIHDKFGTKYDEGINQMLEYCKELETNKII